MSTLNASSPVSKGTKGNSVNSSSSTNNRMITSQKTVLSKMFVQILYVYPEKNIQWIQDCPLTTQKTVIKYMLTPQYQMITQCDQR